MTTGSLAPIQFVTVEGDRIVYRAIGSGTPMVLLTGMRAHSNRAVQTLALS